jgi:membrane-associated phospholipid phosphatase
LIQTPFPEYPSGHSTISASAAVVLTKMVGDNYSFIDSTEVPYGRPTRKFNSFYEASDQASISRLYGGIHF